MSIIDSSLNYLYHVHETRTTKISENIPLAPIETTLHCKYSIRTKIRLASGAMNCKMVSFIYLAPILKDIDIYLHLCYYSPNTNVVHMQILRRCKQLTPMIVKRLPATLISFGVQSYVSSSLTSCARLSILTSRFLS